MVWLIIAAGWASQPTVSLSWKGADARIVVQPPQGFHLAEDARSEVRLRWADRDLQLTLSGRDLARGVSLWGVPGREVLGEFSLQICEDGGTLCSLVELSVGGTVPQARRGEIVLATRARAPHATSFQTDASRVAEAAYATAKEEGKLVLLDFGAVWCPPCNLLAAEVLEAVPPPEELSSYVVAAVDVDHASSWSLKDRYAVGGYPTLVITDVEGQELSRVVGYSGRDDFLAWVDRVAEQRQPDPDPATIDPSTVSPREAARLALRALDESPESVSALLERAAEQEGADLRLARLLHAPTVEDARWLVDHASDRALDWVFSVEALGETEEGKAVIAAAIVAGLHTANGHEASDLLFFAASLAEANEKPLLYGAAAVAAREALAGDPQKDRGYITWIAQLMAHSGDIEGALSLLDEYAALFPGEPTFDLAAGSLLLSREQPERALFYAERAFETSWDDNRLRVAKLKVQALKLLGRSDEAKTFAAEVLASLPPALGVDVRTHRYREALEAAVQ